MRYVRYVVDGRCVSHIDHIGNFNFESGLATACQTPLRGTCDVPRRNDFNWYSMVQLSVAMSRAINSYQ